MSSIEAQVQQMFIDNTYNELAKTPQDTTGLRLRRVKQFIKRAGLRNCNFIVVPPNEKMRIGIAMDVGGFSPLNDVWGFYQPAIDLAVVYRDRIVEALNGHGRTESLIVHELAHGTGKQNEQGIGFRLSDSTKTANTGTFFEEGFAESMSGRYIKHVLKQPDGFISMGNGHTWSTEIDGQSLVLSNTYRFADTDTTFAYGISSLAGMAIDSLTNIREDLWRSMLDSRDNTEHIEDVRRQINGIRHGLYDDLWAIDSTSDFAAGLRLVQEIVL